MALRFQTRSCIVKQYRNRISEYAKTVDREVKVLTSEDRWMSRKELAGRLNLHPQTLSNWAVQGKGPRHARIGRSARYKLSDVIAWEEAQMVDNAA
ncbi:hypothetical protein M2284_002626 [Rhodococcus sp. LBL1]|nr:hypothetical protein [Rhodococcus sp. LBL1]MDH6684010.1 hypothetical protein [Rhodococcus sp. LBL2]